jgi:hypothetical protein
MVGLNEISAQRSDKRAQKSRILLTSLFSLLISAFSGSLLAGVPEASLLAQWPESLNMRSTWQWNRGTVQAIQSPNGITYCGAASSILSFRDPTQVTRTDLPGIAQDLHVAGNYAYVAAGSAGLVVLGLENPDKPTIKATLHLPGYAWNLSKDGNLLLIASGATGLFAIDVTRPEEPSLIIQSRVCDTVNAVVLTQGYAWLAAARDGLVVLDARDPHKLNVVARLPMSGSLQGLTLQDSIAWAACGDSGLATLNVRDPEHPVMIRRDGWPGVVRTTVTGSLAAVAAGVNGVFLLNVQYPDEPYLYRWLPIADGFVQDIAIARETMYVAAGAAGCLKFDVEHPFLPEAIDTLKQPGYTRDIAAQGDVGWVATSNGVYAVDLRSGSNQDIGFCPLRPGPFAIALAENRAVVTRGGAGIGFITTAVPAHPVLTDTVMIPGIATSVTARDSWAWVSSSDSSISVIGLADSRPQVVARLPTTGPTAALHVNGNLLSAVVNGSTVCFYDVATPRNPSLLSQLLLPGPVYSTAAAGSRAVACGAAGLSVIDISSPRSPVFVTQVHLAATGWQVALADTICYIAEDWAGVVAVNVADPHYPWVAGYCAGPSIVLSVALAGGSPIAGDVYSGLLKMQLAATSTLAELPTAPNRIIAASVTASTYVTVRVLTQQSVGRLSLYDPAGRRVSDVTVPGNSGWQEFRFPTDPLGAGVYIARLESRDGTFSVRISVIR